MQKFETFKNALHELALRLKLFSSQKPGVIMMMKQIVYVLLTITQLFISSEMGERALRYVFLSTILYFSKKWMTLV